MSNYNFLFVDPKTFALSLVIVAVLFMISYFYNRNKNNQENFSRAYHSCTGINENTCGEYKPLYDKNLLISNPFKWPYSGGSFVQGIDYFDEDGTVKESDIEKVHYDVIRPELNQLTSQTDHYEFVN